MKPAPDYWPRISSAVFYDDPAAAIDFLCDAFGFEVKIRVEGEDGSIAHSELLFGGGLVMVGAAGAEHDARASMPSASPRAVGGKNTQMLCLYIDDVDAHCTRARAAGAVIADEPFETDHGEEYWADRSYRAVDPEGHHWWFMQRIR